MEWDWAGEGSDVADTGYNGDTVTFTDTPAGLTNFQGLIPDGMGALFEGNSISCTGNGAVDAFVGVPFGI